LFYPRFDYCYKEIKHAYDVVKDAFRDKKREDEA